MEGYAVQVVGSGVGAGRSAAISRHGFHTSTQASPPTTRTSTTTCKPRPTPSTEPPPRIAVDTSTLHAAPEQRKITATHTRVYPAILYGERGG